MRLRPLALIASFALTTACIMPDQLAEYQKQVADVQQSLAEVKRTQTELAQQVAEVKAGDGAVKREDIADLTARLDQVVRETTATSDKVDQVNLRMDRLSQDVQAARDAARRATPPPAAAPGGEPGAPPPPVVVPGPPGAPLTGSAPTPSALYSSAYADFSKGNYALAIQGFAEYAEKYADTELADNAMYWIGECHFSQGSYKAAVDAFDAMLEKYPESDKAAAANLKKALAFVQLNQIGQGIEQLRFVTSTYPGTDEARIASDRLSSLGKP